MEELQDVILTLQKRISELEAKLAEKEVQEYVEDLKRKEKYLPRFDEFVLPTLQGLPVTEEQLKEYAEKNPVEIMREREKIYQENMKKLLESLPRLVNFSETGVSEKEEAKKDSDEELHEYAEKLVVEKGLSYRDAVIEAAKTLKRR